MELNNNTLYGGLHLMYIGQIVLLIGIFGGIFLLLIPGLSVLGLLVLLAGAVGAIISIVGQFKLRNEHPDYMTAFVLLIVAFVLNLIYRNSTEIIAAVSDLGGSAVSLAGTYFVIRATNSFLSRKGREDLAAKGKTTLIVQIVTSVAAILLGLLTDVLGDNLGGLLVLLIAVSALGIIGGLFIISYLKVSAEALR